MYEVTARCGLARTGALDTGRGTLQTPGVLFLRAEGQPEPPWAEAFLARKPAPDALVVDPGPEVTPDAVLPLARPHSLADLEWPRRAEAGDVAFVAAPEAARDAPKEVVALENAVQFLRRPKGFVRALVALRQVAGYQRALYAPLLATPANLPVLVYAGVDLLDVLRVLYDTQKGRFHTSEASIPASEMDAWPCLCPGCEAGDLGEHNLRQVVAELRRVRDAVRRGYLRELVEARIANDPWMTAVLREFDLRYGDWQELHAPVSGPPLRAYAPASLRRAEVVRFRRRVRERYRRPPSAEVLLLLPCSARKPYTTSKSHRLYRSVVRRCGNPWAVHVVVVTSPLGLVPLDLQLAYPAQHYDVPVTGDWSRDEAAILEEDLAAYLKANPYRAVVAHLGAEEEVVAPLLEDAAVTADGEPRSPSALDRLESALREAVADLESVPAGRRRGEELASMARFQFGPGGEALVARVTTQGRYPHWRLLKDGRQVAALTGSRGLLALTLEGGRILAERDLAWVEIDDFVPEGNVFAVGVEDAHPEVRIGDDVAVRHRGEVRAVGVAQMSPEEMRTSVRGEAVRVRHRVEKE